MPEPTTDDQRCHDEHNKRPVALIPLDAHDVLRYWLFRSETSHRRGFVPPGESDYEAEDG